MCVACFSLLSIVDVSICMCVCECVRIHVFTCEGANDARACVTVCQCMCCMKNARGEFFYPSHMYVSQYECIKIYILNIMKYFESV
jgi:hypothetical protein